jgi:transcriptional regulator with XRE-family HTH domain
MKSWYGPETATFGDRVAASREAADMTQAELARRLGVRLTTLQSWEDDLSEPRANRLSIMAGLLNVSMMWLINGEGEGLTEPVSEGEISPEVRSLLNELRDTRVDMLARAEHLGRLEKKLRNVLQSAEID